MAAKTRSRIWRGVLIVGVLGAAAWWVRDVLEPKPVEVHVTRVERGTVESTVTNFKAGTITARRRAGVSPEIGGTVAEVLYSEGDHVCAGEVIVRLNDESLRARLRVAQRELELVRARAEQAQIAGDHAGREHQRASALAVQNLVTKEALDVLVSRWDELKAAARAATAEVERSVALVALAEAELHKTEIRAPFSGVVAEIDVEVGEWATPSPPLLRAPSAVDLIDLRSPYVAAPMDEVDSASIHAGQDARITVDSRSGEVFAGRVNRVAPYVLDLEQQNRTVEIEVDFLDTDPIQGILPGTSADVEVILEQRDNVLRIPAMSLGSGNRVLVVIDGRLTEREIQTGLKNWDWVEVVDGLQEGEALVASADRSALKDGALARVVEDEREP